MLVCPGRRGQGFESRTRLNFFRRSFCNCKSCVHNCEDLLCIQILFRLIRFPYIHYFKNAILQKTYTTPTEISVSRQLCVLSRKTFYNGCMISGSVTGIKKMEREHGKYYIFSVCGPHAASVTHLKDKGFVN